MPLPGAPRSNFDYLMHLNREAGRSFKDLSQYPVRAPGAVCGCIPDCLLSLQRNCHQPCPALLQSVMSVLFSFQRAFVAPTTFFLLLCVHGPAVIPVCR